MTGNFSQIIFHRAEASLLRWRKQSAFIGRDRVAIRGVGGSVLSAEPALHIELFDRFCVRYGDEPVTAINTVRLQSLLAYLLLHCRQSRRREELAYLFWPDSTDAQARTNLRRELHNLRQALPEADRFLDTGTQTLRWRPDAPFTLDVDRFEGVLESVGRDKPREDPTLKLLEEAVGLYRGDLLSGLYDAWLEPERERLRLAYKGALGELISRLETKRDYKAALRYVQRLLQLEPLDEPSHRAAIRLHALSGDRAGALHSYHKCVTLLQRELNVEPSLATRKLYENLLGAEGQPSERRLLNSASPLVGRQGAWQELLEAWRRAQGAKAQFVAISGEAGIGKTRLAEELLWWAAQQGVTGARTRSYAAEGRLPFAPMREILLADGFKTALRTLEPVWLAELSRLLPELAEHSELPKAEPLGEGWQRQRLFEALARATLSAPQPLVLLFDDLQWCDPDTLEWLHYLLRFEPLSKLLVVGTIRSEEQADNPALSTLLLDLQQLEHLTCLELGPLNPTETALLSTQISGQRLNEAQTAQLFAETEGHPLFVVETAHAGLLDGEREERRRQPTSPDPAVPNRRALPPKVWAVITTRLAQLSPETRDLVGLAATVGRAFSFDMLHRAGDLDEETLVRSLDELWQRRIVREQSLNTYDFSHDRIRELAYAQVSPVRKRLLHRRVAQALELLYAPDLSSVSAPLAAHYEQAGQTAKAIGYYQQAAAAAVQVSAYGEAVRLLSRGLTLLGQLPANQERQRQELALQIALLEVLGAVHGYTSAELDIALGRVYTLGKELGDESAVIHSLWGLMASNIVRGRLELASHFGVEALVFVKDNPALLSDIHNALCGICVVQGQLTEARSHYQRAVALYELRPGRRVAFGADSRVFSLSWGSHGLCLQGYLDEALANSARATTLADELEHPYTRVLANAYRALLHGFRREVEAAAHCAEIVLQESNKYGIVYYREWGVMMSGWVRAQRGAAEEGAAQIRSGLKNLQALGAQLRRPYYLSLLAEAHLILGQPEAARPLLDAAISTATQNSDVWWLPELHRLRGELLADSHAEAEFRQALQIAQGQGNKLLELRSAVSLAQLWQRQGKGEEAYDLLNELYGWFTEGFDTSDLQKARTLLEALS